MTSVNDLDEPVAQRVVSDDGNFMVVAKVYTYYPTGKPTEPKRGWLINVMCSNEYGHWENADFYFNSIFLDCVIDLLTKTKELLGSFD